ncbi:MAG: nuclear transport factor 2 family protein [Actinobacteria bacterium]|nr:nuclear transport factor 2 family protein [Actinomycetota bacterium]
MTTTTTDHITIISDLYTAFGRGDLASMLAPLAEDVSWDADWADLFSQRAGLGVVTPRHGIDGAREFFALLGTFQVHEFRVLDLMASQTQVVAQVTIELTYPSGGRVRDEELHLWRFDDDHKIAALRHYVDTAKHIAAWNGQDTTHRNS